MATEAKRLNENDLTREELTPESATLFNEWTNTEWSRCMDLRASFENHAVTFLLTANGGGAASVIAFAGAASYATYFVYGSLTVFVLGLITCGIAIDIGRRRMSWISRELSADQKTFNAGGLGVLLAHRNHEERFSKKTGGACMGYFSFASFICGVILSILTFNEFIAYKQQQSTARNFSECSSVQSVEVPTAKQADTTKSE